MCNTSIAGSNVQGSTGSEATRRQQLSRVFGEFDIELKGVVGEQQLLAIGRARRALGQIGGEWTEAENKQLMATIGTDDQGVDNDSVTTQSLYSHSTPLMMLQSVRAWCVSTGHISEDQFMSYFLRVLEANTQAEFDKSISHYTDCAHACRKNKFEEFRAQIESGRALAAQMKEELLTAENVSKAQQGVVNELQRKVVQLERGGMLSKVYHAFDLDGNGVVGELELLAIGRARRALQQIDGEWTEEENKKLLRLMGPDDQGALSVECLVYC